MTVRYSAFQRKVLQAVLDLRDPGTHDIAAAVGSTANITQRSLALLRARGMLTKGPRWDGPWHVTTAGRRRLADWGTGR